MSVNFTQHQTVKFYHLDVHLQMEISHIIPYSYKMQSSTIILVLLANTKVNSLPRIQSYLFRKVSTNWIFYCSIVQNVIKTSWVWMSWVEMRITCLSPLDMGRINMNNIQLWCMMSHCIQYELGVMMLGYEHFQNKRKIFWNCSEDFLFF